METTAFLVIASLDAISLTLQLLREFRRDSPATIVLQDVLLPLAALIAAIAAYALFPMPEARRLCLGVAILIGGFYGWQVLRPAPARQ